MAAAAGNVAYDLAGDKRPVIRDNVAHSMGLPPITPRQSAARRAFRNYAKYLVDMMRLGELTPDAAAELVDIDNIELLDEARARREGRPALHHPRRRDGHDRAWR